MSMSKILTYNNRPNRIHISLRSAYAWAYRTKRIGRLAYLVNKGVFSRESLNNNSLQPISNQLYVYLKCETNVSRIMALCLKIAARDHSVDNFFKEPISPRLYYGNTEARKIAIPNLIILLCPHSAF